MVASQEAKKTKLKTIIVGNESLIERVFDNLKDSYPKDYDKKMFNKNIVKMVTKALLSEMASVLVEGNNLLRLGGFGTIKNVKTASRVAMNLKTKQRIIIPARVVPKMRFSDELKNRIIEKNSL